MAIIKCVECGNEYSTTAPVCPNCGFTPAFRRCEDCGAVSSVKTDHCACCGAVWDDSLEPVSSDKTAGYYEDLVSRLNAASDPEEALAVSRGFASLLDYKFSASLKDKAKTKSSYLKGISLMDSASTASDWKKAMDLLSSIEGTEDSKELASSCAQAYKELRYKELEDRYKDAGDNKDLLKELSSAYKELGDYEEAPARLAEIKKKLGRGRNKAIKISLISLAAALLVAGSGFLIYHLVTVTIPGSHLNKGIEAYNGQDYQTAVDEFTAAGSYEDAETRLADATIALHYQTGDQLFNQGDYQGAIAEFTAAGGYGDSMERIDLCEDAGHYTAGIALFEQGEYEDAITELMASRKYGDAEDKISEARFLWGQDELAAGNLNEGALLLNEAGTDEAMQILSEKGDELVASKDYETLNVMFKNVYGDCYKYNEFASGMLDYNEGDYVNAYTHLSGAGGLGSSEDLIPECAFNAGVKALAEGRLSTAESYFTAIRTNPDYPAADLIKVCDAEEANKNDDLKTAYETYLEVPTDLEVEGFDVQGRRSLFTRDAAADAARLCGTFDATSNDTSVVDKGRYYQDGWELTNVHSGQYIDISAHMNDDGTFDFTGYVNYYAFTEYSVLREYTEGEIMTDLISIEGVNKFPKNYDSGIFSDLTYKDNKFTLHYKYVDNYSTYFKYIYESKVVYKVS